MVFIVSLALIVGLALLVLAAVAGVYWVPEWDRKHPGEEPPKVLTPVFWLGDLLWDFRGWWGWTCPYCSRNWGSTEGLALHLHSDPSCGYRLQMLLAER